VKFVIEPSQVLAGDFPTDLESLSEELERLASIIGEAGKAVVALTVASSEMIKNLNASYRGMDEPTDVLSFPLWEERGVFAPPSGWDALPLGDVVVSPEIVRQNAKRENIGYNSEMARMIIHGVLHLIGFDHDTKERYEEMWTIQESILDKYSERARTKGGLMTE
jgi:probable rRNA maturation factor